MKYILGLLTMLSILSACQKESVDSKIAHCPNANKQYKRTSPVHNVSAFVRTAVINNKPTNEYWIYPEGNTERVPWVACNLPVEFQQDSLKIIISGYFLTYPGFELMNVRVLPFEVTEIEENK